MPSAAWQAPRPRVIVRFFRKATCGLPAITFCCTWMNIGRPPPPTRKGPPQPLGRRSLVHFLREAVMGRVGRRVATLESSYARYTSACSARPLERESVSL
jgi:hypothetical protein